MEVLCPFYCYAALPPLPGKTRGYTLWKDEFEVRSRCSKASPLVVYGSLQMSWELVNVSRQTLPDISRLHNGLNSYVTDTTAYHLSEFVSQYQLLPLQH